MSDAEDLMKARELLELAPDDLTDCAADAGVDFVEDDRGDAPTLRFKAFQREHHARQLTTGGDPGERQRRLSEIGREVELDRIETGWTQRDPVVDERGALIGNRSEARLEDRTAHSERFEFGFHPALEAGGVMLTLLMEHSPPRQQVPE